MRARWALLLVVPVLLSACGGGDNGSAGPDIFEFTGFSESLVLNYEVDVGVALPQAGELRVVGIDPGYRDGVDAYQVELRQNANLIATRWYQLDATGVFLLGEQAVEGSGVVERTYITPIKIIPYPFSNVSGVPVQNWSTTSELEQGGQEQHRFDNQGEQTLQVPAGSFTAYRLLHQRTYSGGQGGDTVTLEEYFSPGNWFVKFEYSDQAVWSLAPAGG